MTDRLKPVPIPEARRLANEHGASRLLILGVDDHGNFAFTTFGRTKKQCSAMRLWAEMAVPGIGVSMDDATRETDR